MTSHRPARGWTAVVLLLATDLTAQGPAALVKDINTVPESYQANSNPQEFTVVNGQILFAATTPNIGSTLWQTDGTPAGTRLFNGRALGPRLFTPMGGATYFNASGQLWRTDGTQVGTVPFASVAFQPNGLRPLAAVNGRLVFGSLDPVLGWELFASDGTAAGTTLLADLRPGVDSSTPDGFVVSANRCFFTADDGVHGREPWVTDGTAAGTMPLGDIRPGTRDSIFFNAFDVIASPGGIYFSADDGVSGMELWFSDGTAAGTRQVADIAPGAASSLRWLHGAWTGTEILFDAGEGAAGFELWRSDGTAAGTRLVLDIEPGAGWSSPGQFLWTGTTLYFGATTIATGRELWRSDGTAAGTRLVADIEPGTQSSDPGRPVWTGSMLLFVATTAAAGMEPWRSDGTAAGTRIVRDVFPGTGPGFSGYGGMSWVNGMLLFAGTDGSATGIEPWRSDGTTTGTALVQDIAQPAGSSWPRTLVDAQGTLFFQAFEASLGVEPWRSDGSTSGTQLVRDITPGSYTQTVTTLMPLANLVLFAANDFVHGVEPWRSDGTTSGTQMVTDLLPGGLGSDPAEWVRFGDGVAFTAKPQLFAGRGLWTTDGVSSRPLGTFANAVRPAVIGRTLYYSSNQGATGYELWKLDGTTQQLVKDIWPGPSASNPRSLIELDGQLYFFADDPGGIGLWRSDGTTAGTQMVRYVRAIGGLIPELVRSGSLLFFMANEGGTGLEPWRSDGTAAGTFLLKDINPGPATSGVQGLRAWDGLVLFAANDGAHGFEPWRSDGTSAGTVLIQDVRPGPSSSVAEGVPLLLALPAARTFLFAADDGQHGVELWRSDGTAAGTALFQDLNPGIWHSRPDNAAVSGSLIYFGAEDNSHGHELWAMAAMAHAAPFGVGCVGTGDRVPVIASSGGAPVLGNGAFAVDLAAARPNSVAVLALGSPAEVPVGNGCWIHFASLLLTLFITTDAAGSGQVPMPIPNDASLRGGAAACQFGVSDPAGAFQGILAFSPGLRIVLADD